jgi:hypothetical protein
MSKKKLLKYWDQDKMIRAATPVRNKQMGFNFRFVVLPSCTYSQ